MTFEEIVNHIGIKPYYKDEWCAIYHADCRDILPLIPDKSIDLVLTDPPYLAIDFINNIYEQIATMGSKCLKEGGFLYAYVGCEFLPKAINQLTEKLNWFWLYNIRLDGNTPRMWNKHLFVKSKPIIAVTRGHPQELAWSKTDYYSHYHKDKVHKWMQDEIFPAAVISERTKSNELILDPFLGSGTTCYCAKKLNRYSIGIEIEEKYCEIAAKRCSQSVMRLEA